MPAERSNPPVERDAFAGGFRVAAVAALLALPFALAMRRRPSEAQPVARRARAGEPAPEPSAGARAPA